MAEDAIDASEWPIDASLREVLISASKLQELVPDAVLVGGSAAALYAGHRASFDHDRVVGDLKVRFDVVLDALDRDGEFVLNRVVPGKIVLGELGGIQTGIRQLIRSRPLEVQRVDLGGGHLLTVPTLAEALRIKAYLVVRRNQVRDYLDVAALSERTGVDGAARILLEIDDYYADTTTVHDAPVLSQLIRQLSDPKPADSRVIPRLSDYKSLSVRWRDWASVVARLRDVASELLANLPEGES